MIERRKTICRLSSEFKNWLSAITLRCSKSQWAKGVAAPIVGATKASYLDDAAAALDLQLTKQDIAYLEAPYQPHAIVGAINHNPDQGTVLIDEKKDAN